jgi:hypothetical protein
MDPFQINAAYRQNELLEEAQADGLLKATRAGRPEGTGTPLRDLHGRIVGFARRLGRPRTTTSPRKATA